VDVSAVQESLARCTVRGGFAARFLALLGEGHPALARTIATGDPREQRRVLRRGLQMMILYAQGAPMAATLLERSLDDGSAGGMGNAVAVHPDLHPFWVDTLLRVVREFDPGFSPGLEKRWREVLGAALTHLAARHRRA